MLTLSPVFHEIAKAYLSGKYRYIINQGGTSSTKTFSLLQLLYQISRKHNKQIDIVGQSMPHLKTGVLNDMPYICDQFADVFDDNYNKSDKKLKAQKGTINFLSFDKLGKSVGGRRDILFLNEANHLNYKIVEQLMIRTRDVIFIDYNPTNKFWVQDKILKEEPEKAFVIHSTYKDNPFLEQSIIDSLESKRGDGTNNFWRVYGLGELGVSEGLVFNNFAQRRFAKESFNNYRHGVDWGFSNDPFAYVRMAIDRKKLYICDEVYQRGLHNNVSAELIKPFVKQEPVFCDSSEPKSVDEYKNYGINARSAKKGQGSIETGIKFLQSFEEIVIHPDCHNIYDEFSNYQWKEDKSGNQLPTPIDSFNHGIDAIRYAVENDIPGGKRKFFVIN